MSAAVAYATRTGAEKTQLVLDHKACGGKSCQCEKSRRAGHGLTHCLCHAPDNNPSMNVTPKAGGEALLLHCHAGCGQPELFAAFRELDDGRTPATHSKAPVVKSGKPKRHPGPADHRYQYLDAAGGLVATKSRWDATPEYLKDFEWPANTDAKDLIYGAELLTEHPEDSVLYVEGEACADAARAAGMPCAITGGAGVPGREALSVLAGRRVYLFADNDTHGVEVMHGVHDNLPECKKVLWVVNFTAKPRDDVVDFLAAHPEDGKLALRRLLKESMPYRDPEPVFTHDAGVASSDAEAPVAPAGQETASPGFLLSSVAPEPVEWLWQDHIPIGKLTMFDGDPGLGKSVMSLDLAARVTQGREMPDGKPGAPPAHVVVMTAEDGIADTVSARAIAAGADCDRIVIIEDIPDTDGGHMPAIPGDIDALERTIRCHGVKLVIIDPLSAYFGPEIDANNDPKVRRALAPLAKMAERCGVAIILIRHLTKDTDRKALHRGGGSMGIIGAARAGFVIAEDNDGADNDRVIAPTKFNLGPKPDALKFSTESAQVGDIETVKIAWHGRSLLTADSLLSGPMEPGKLEDAIDFIEDQLSGCKWVAQSMMTERARSAKITTGSLKRAKKHLGVVSFKDDGAMSGPWKWRMPTEAELSQVAP